MLGVEEKAREIEGRAPLLDIARSRQQQLDDLLSKPNGLQAFRVDGGDVWHARSLAQPCVLCD